MAQHRHHQPGLGLRRDAHVHRAVPRDDAGFVVEQGIDLRKVRDRQHHRAHEKGQQREFAPAVAEAGVELCAQRLEFGHVAFLDIG
jgi:hypothetical protein